MALNQLLRQVGDALGQQSPQGARLAAAHLRLAVARPPLVRELEALPDVGGLIQDRLGGSAYAEAASGQIRAVLHWSRGRAVDAYAALLDACTAFLRGFQSDTAWALELLYRLVIDLRVAAAAADEALAKGGQKADRLEDAARVLNRCFQATITDRAALEASKRWGALHVINSLLKIYFRLHNLRLGMNLMKHVEAPNFPPLAQFPLSQLVTFRFYKGRLDLFDGHYARAADELAFAFTRCTRRAPRNKRLALLFLVPLRLLHGVFPTARLLRKHNLTPLIGLVEALKLGNVQGFNEAMSTHAEFFIQRGIYLTLEKLKYIAYRNLFKRVYAPDARATLTRPRAVRAS